MFNIRGLSELSLDIARDFFNNCGARTSDPRSEEWAWVEGGRSTLFRRRLGEVPASTKGRHKSQSLVTERRIRRDDDPTRLDWDTTVQYEPETDPRRPPEAGSDLWGEQRSRRGRAVGTVGRHDYIRRAAGIWGNGYY